ncbi:MAG: hypothetical protein ACK4Y7_06100 [Caldimicrobium sp.]
MGEFGEILRKLKYKSEEREEAKILERRATLTKLTKRKFTSILLGVFFLGSVFLGLGVVKALHYLKVFKDKRTISSLPTQALPSSPQTLSPPSQVLPSSTKETSPSPALPPSKKTKSSPILTQNKLKEKKVSSLSPKSKLALTPVKKFQKEKAFKKESEEEKVIAKDGLLLREANLLNNLLLNAEEARKKGNLEEAIHFYETYLKYKNDPDVLNNLGSIYLLKGDYAKVEYYVKKALALKSDEIYLLNLYLAKLKQGKKEEVCKEVLTKEFSPSYKKQIDKLIEFCK